MNLRPMKEVLPKRAPQISQHILFVLQELSSGGIQKPSCTIQKVFEIESYSNKIVSLSRS